MRLRETLQPDKPPTERGNIMTQNSKGFSITFNDEDGMPVGVRFASPIPDEAALKLRERIISETVEIEIVANGTLDTETYREVVYDGAFFIFKDKDGGIITTGGIVHDPHIVKPLIIGAGVMHGRITRFWVQPAGVNEVNIMPCDRRLSPNKPPYVGWLGDNIHT